MADVSITELAVGAAIGISGWAVAAIRRRDLAVLIAKRFFGGPAALRADSAGEPKVPLADLIAQQVTIGRQQATALEQISDAVSSLSRRLDEFEREKLHERREFGALEARVSEVERIRPRVEAIERRVTNVERAAHLSTRAADRSPEAP